MVGFCVLVGFDVEPVLLVFQLLQFFVIVVLGNSPYSIPQLHPFDYRELDFDPFHKMSIEQ